MNARDLAKPRIAAAQALFGSPLRKPAATAPKSIARIARIARIAPGILRDGDIRLDPPGARVPLAELRGPPRSCGHRQAS